MRVHRLYNAVRYLLYAQTVVFLYMMTLSPSGIAETMHLLHQIQSVKDANIAIATANTRLMGKIDAVDHDTHWQSYQARDSLGMIKPREMYFQYRNND